MGRRRKFQLGEIVVWDGNQYGVVVEYRHNLSRSYYVVETSADGSSPHGKPRALKSSDMESANRGTVQKPVTIYNRNLKNGNERECQCRVHR